MASKPVFSDLFTFSGRRNRESFMLFNLTTFAVVFGVSVFIVVLDWFTEHRAKAFVDVLASIFFVLLLPVMVAHWAVGGQRCRDFGWTGWASLLTAVPYLGLIFFIAMCVAPGNTGPNQYGEDPLE